MSHLTDPGGGMQQAIKSHADALLEAGLRLSRRVPLSRVTTAVVATEAGLPSVRFFDAYPDLVQYLIDLYQQHFLLPVRQQLEATLAQLPPGRERGRIATQVYLDFCLKHRGLRRWIIEARAWREFDAAYNRASQGFQAMAQPGLQALGFSDGAGASRLFSAMMYEIAAVEMQDGHEHAGMRQCLWRLLGSSERPVLRFATRPTTPAPLPTATATPRQRLLQAGEQLLSGSGGDPGALQLEALLAQADVDRASFDASFGDLKTFQVALIQSWAEHFMASCLAASQGLPPGAERIHAFLTAAWDCNLNEQRGQRLLMKALLATDAEVRARILARVQGFTRIVAIEYQALGVSSPQAMARLFVAASSELVEAEEVARRALPQLRETFWQMFDPLVAGVRAGTRKSRRPRETVEPAQAYFLTTQIGTAISGSRRRLSAAAKNTLRQRLVEAGDHLLRSGAGVSELGSNRLALLAGVETDEFSACYPDFNVYLTDLLTFLLDESRDITVEATAHQAPGIMRMWRGIEVFLDARLDRPAIHELSRRLQGHTPAARLSRSRSSGFVRIFATEFHSAGWPDPQENAHLMVALVSETVQAEYEAGRRLPEYRATLHAFLTRG